MANFKLTQTGEQIQADLDLLDKNSATQGQVLTANGTGGATWQDASGGGTQLYLHTIVTSNHTFYIVTNGAEAFNPTDDIKENALLNSIVYNKWIGVGGFNNKFVFGMSIGVKKGSIPPSYHTSPTTYQKGNALSYYDSNGNEVTILRSNFGSFVSDTVTPL